MEQIKTDEVKNKHKIKGDLNYLMKEFSREQKRLLEIERQEEEKQTLDNIYNYSARVR
jgi:hypothetical protein